MRVRWEGSTAVPLFPDECVPHDKGPAGFLEWGRWAKEMERTHVHRQCPGCGLWEVWEPKEETSTP